MAQLEIRNLQVAFGAVRAVDDVTLDVEKGELLCLLGPNGAGKSTTLDLICGKTRPTGGTVLFEGVDITNMAEFRRARHGVGRKFQIPSVFKELTIAENMEVARSQQPGILAALQVFRPRDARRMQAILDRVGLREMADVRAANLSHGQTQWLEIAMLLAQDSKLLLMDEPTAGMTIQETQKTAEIFNNLRGEHTIIVVEHDMNFVRKVAERVTVLERGRVLATGTIAEIEADAAVKTAYLGH